MKKVLLVAAIILFSGCSISLETSWNTSKVIGNKVLNEDTKSKLKPVVKGIESVW